MAKWRTADPEGRIGRLTIIGGFLVEPPQANRHMIAECDCGNITFPTIRSLRRGDAKSCGCLGLEHRIQAKRDNSEYDNRGAGRAYLNHKNGAIRRKHEWGLTPESWTQIITANCAYCGDLPKHASGPTHARFLHNGIDRIDSNVGYIKGNVVACCKHCNWSKNTFSVDEFKTHVRKMARHMNVIGNDQEE